MRARFNRLDIRNKKVYCRMFEMIYDICGSIHVRNEREKIKGTSALRMTKCLCQSISIFIIFHGKVTWYHDDFMLEG